MSLADAYADRDPNAVHLLRFFEYAHLPERLQAVSAPCAQLADDMMRAVPDGPELFVGMRKLLEAKDCFVRGAL